MKIHKSNIQKSHNVKVLKYKKNLPLIYLILSYQKKIIVPLKHNLKLHHLQKNNQTKIIPQILIQAMHLINLISGHQQSATNPKINQKLELNPPLNTQKQLLKLIICPHQPQKTHTINQTQIIFILKDKIKLDKETPQLI